MSASRISSSALGDIRQIVASIRQHVAQGTTEKLIEDENFVFQMLKLMVEDAVDIGIKTEFLRVLEDCGGDVLDAKSIDEVASNLFGIFRQYESRDDSTNFLTQLLITVTTLLVSSENIPTDPAASLIEILWSIAARVNDVGNRRLRAVACQCMVQLELTSPGVMWRWRDRLVQAVKQDRSDVCQDYVTLLTTVLYHVAGDIGVPESPITPDTSQRASMERMVSVSGGPGDTLSAVSFIMDHSTIFTPAGLWDILASLSGIVQHSPGISPTIFKPLMLHHMATQDPCLMHIVLYLQREYSGEILTSSEEKLLMTRLVTAVNQKSISPAHRLIFLQWLKGYCLLEDEEDSTVMGHVREKLSWRLLPSVFDSVDLHVGKVTALNICTQLQADTGSEELSLLLSSLTYLKKLTVCTGEHKVAVSLYRCLYNIQAKHCSQDIATNIIKICQTVLSSYPRLIPLVLNFLQCVRDQAADTVVYLNILSSLHKQVLSSPAEDVLRQFQFYLLVLKTSAKEADISPLPTMTYLLSVAERAVSLDQCSWHLGNAILAVVRSVLLNHPTEGIFTELGDLLHETMRHFLDIDVQDKARFYYALLTGAADKKIRDVLSDAMQGGRVTEQTFSSLLPGSMNTPMRTELHQVKQPIFQWERLGLLPEFKSETSFTFSSDVSSYYQWLDTLTVSLQITHSLQVLQMSQFDTLHALSIKVDTSNVYRQHKDIHVAFMNRHDTKQLSVELQPTLPDPASFDTSAMFASYKNDTYYCRLPTTDISFEDLLLPYPWTHVGLEEQNKSLFFSSLWDHITGCSDPREGLQSVKIVSCPLKKLQQEWDRFRLGPDKTSYLIFLPARYHLLFKVHERQDNLVVSIATDYWKILPHVNEYLAQLDS
ncbi:AP-5 complex subunit beta-1-like [Haliotis rufescens]|uniref:AP-5 complex subunit beta-1-like n=1 Tax=Haliotis rufescens TaxID=6454 RepID=UPI001EAFB01F|nr:AP-5 complex subunit beta-1-like [Haliotis rufescens]